MRTNPRSAIAVLVAAALLALAACEKKVDQAHFDRVNTGMSLAEVEKIMGKGAKQDVGGVSISGSGIAGGKSSNAQVTYIWQDGQREIAVTFQDDKVISKNKSGM